ncbi:TetR/AcrR family transcriptional regulator [Deinococcus yavapaiensis]|uniref:TetR family transcriptional regulator n=1 Tax=Deinococcus yavapaiensis KR-236 TaxID=694435 RepID=A0A318S1W2_9DEIO|nr:TetR/AcrR family transcriptional regulator [Deinococcus yavapaiensis]PYE49005.1 TetR family transcriptional regulator [Deinococcus yavapaiensis KR-236]
MTEQADTRERILDVAQRLVQHRGYHAVSYKDVGEQLGIRNASIHYHFPSKADLGLALVRRYRERLQVTLAALDVLSSPAERLSRFVDAYRDVVRDDGRVCLCTVLAAEDPALPETLRPEVRAFLDFNERWLARVLAEGRAEGELRFDGSPEAAAAAFLATLEGAMLLARSAHDPARFDLVVRHATAALHAARFFQGASP